MRSILLLAVATSLALSSCANLTPKQNAALVDTLSTVVTDLAANKTPKQTALDAAMQGLKDLKAAQASGKAVANPLPTPAAP